MLLKGKTAASAHFNQRDSRFHFFLRKRAHITMGSFVAWKCLKVCPSKKEEEYTWKGTVKQNKFYIAF